MTPDQWNESLAQICTGVFIHSPSLARYARTGIRSDRVIARFNGQKGQFAQVKLAATKKRVPRHCEILGFQEARAPIISCETQSAPAISQRIWLIGPVPEKSARFLVAPNSDRPLGERGDRARCCIFLVSDDRALSTGRQLREMVPAPASRYRRLETRKDQCIQQLAFLPFGPSGTPVKV